MLTLHLPGGSVRYVKIESVYDSDSAIIGEEIHLYESPEKIFQITGGREGKYLGCGIDTAQSFLKWLGLDISQKELENHYIKTGSIPGFNGIFTIPSWLAHGLHHVISHKTNHPYQLKQFIATTSESFVDFVTVQLKRGFPVISLINHGKHWILIVGIYHDGKTIRLRVIDNGTTGTIRWEHSGILNWRNKVGAKLIRLIGYRSYKEGILITLEPKNL